MAFPQLATSGGIMDADYEEIETPDGGVIVRIGTADQLARAASRDDGEEGPDFYENLALTMDESALNQIAEELFEGIEADITAATPHMANWERAMSILGLEMKQPRGEATGEGISQVDHPLLLEACLTSQSNECAELYPAKGPVKIDNGGRETAISDELASRLEDDFNEYLTVHRPEYIPDCEEMSFQKNFGGMAFRKVYHCPLRRAPVSDSVSPPNLIVNAQAKSIETALRATHRIRMDPATVKRMQYVGAWRDVDLQTPAEDITLAERKTAAIAGINPSSHRQEDVDYTIYECCCMLDMPGDEHKDENGRVTGLPRPYIVTIEKDTRQVLEVRRNWVEDDELFTVRRRFIAFRYVPAFGFYSIGLLHILSNTNSALTAGWRIMIDAGMLANFPGGLYLKTGERQQDNNFRAGPGQFAPVDANGADDIRKVVAPYPYREPGPASQAFLEHVAETGARVGGVAQIAVAEGKADAPVGTTLAALEQVSKLISAVHRRAHQSQALEFQTMLGLFRERPEDFVKYFKQEGFWTVERFLEALNTYTLIPRADPNTPTQMHRIIKAMGLKQLEQLAPDRYDGRKVDAHIMRTALGIDDPEEYFAPPAQPGALPPDPTLAVANLVAQTEANKAATNERIKHMEAQVKIMLERMKLGGQRDIAELKEDGAMSRELLKLEGQQAEREHQAAEADIDRDEAAAAQQADHEHQRGEGEASRQSAVQLAKMKPKPAPGGKH